jgi:hypothetical protein
MTTEESQGLRAVVCHEHELDGSIRPDDRKNRTMWKGFAIPHRKFQLSVVHFMVAYYI